VDDFRAWLAFFGDKYAPLIERLASVEAYFGSLADLRSQLAGIFKEHLRPKNG